MVGVPAAVVVIVVEHGLAALGAVLHDARTNIAAFLRLFVPGDVIVELGVQNKRPINRVQVAELWVFLDPNGASRDVPQVEKPDVLQTGHLEDHQGVVVE